MALTRKLHIAAVSAALSLAAVLSSGSARAQAASSAAPGSVTAMPKGTIGAGLLGAEVVCITMGAIGVSSGWPYFVFGAVGAGGGAAGGYFVDKGSTTAEPSIALLAGGMALVIPALVVSLNATSYHPPEAETKDTPGNEPKAEPPKPSPGPGPVGGSETPPNPPKKVASRAVRRVPPHVPIGALEMNQGKVSLGVPAPEVRPLFTEQQIAEFHVQQGTEVRVPVFRAMF